MAVATVDLASVTDALVAALDTAIRNSSLWTVNGGTATMFDCQVSGLPFDLARTEARNQVALSLLHVVPNASYRNETRRGPGGITVPLSPTALTLTYGLCTFAGKDTVIEQQAMGIALDWVLANPFQRVTIAGTPPRQVEFTMTLETASIDEITRIWQALTGAMRLTVLIRVGVVFLGPEPAPVTQQRSPTRLGVLVAPDRPRDTAPHLLTATEPVVVVDPRSRAPLRPGETCIVAGVGLDGSVRFFLSPADDSADFDVTAWTSQHTANTAHLTLPAASGTPPGGAPAAGRYHLRIGTAPRTGAPIVLEIGA